MPPIQIKLDDKQLQLTVEGVKKLGAAAVKTVLDEIGATAIDILGLSVKKLSDNKSVATSNLSNSGKVKKIKNGWTVGYTASYAWVVEYGRRAGTYPPISPLIAWVKKKLRINDEKEQKKVAFMVSRSIMRNGTKAKPFLAPAFNESMKGFNNRVINAINKALK